MNLNNFENYLNDWLYYLDAQDTGNSGNYTGPRCPFAKKAKVKTVKVYDYDNAYSYWSVVARECDLFFSPQEYDLILVVAESNYDFINPNHMEGGVQALNASLNYHKKDMWVIDEIGTLFTISLISPISALDDGSKILGEKGYYAGRLTDYKLDMLVNFRRKMRESL